MGKRSEAHDLTHILVSITDPPKVPDSNASGLMQKQTTMSPNILGVLSVCMVLARAVVFFSAFLV